jgi:clan AA aspartic protease (TIGR02281 family)
MTISLKNKRNGILRIDVKLWMPHIRDYAKAEAIFDTGAAKTIIDEKLARLLQLELRKDSVTTTVTASGTIKAYMVNLPELCIGTAVVTDIPVSVMSLPKELMVRCIIGMNVLQEFDIAISNYNQKVSLFPNPLPKRFFTDNYSVTLASDTEDEW